MVSSIHQGNNVLYNPESSIVPGMNNKKIRFYKLWWFPVMANINKNMLEIKAYTNTERETLNFF